MSAISNRPIFCPIVPNRVPSWVCAHAGVASSPANKKRESTFLLFEAGCVKRTIEAIIIHPPTICSCAQDREFVVSTRLNEHQIHPPRPPPVSRSPPHPPPSP